VRPETEKQTDWKGVTLRLPQAQCSRTALLKESHPSAILNGHSGKSDRARFFAALKIVARASRPPWRGHLAREVLRGRDALATAGETPALRRCAAQLFSWFLGAAGGMSDCHENDSPPQREEG